MRYIRRGLALCLAMLLMLASAVAEVPFLQHTAGWTLDGVPLEVLLRADVTSLMPYDEERLAMFTEVTDELSLRLQSDENGGSVTILVGQSQALTMSTRGSAKSFSASV